jgi:hypothetical protein
MCTPRRAPRRSAAARTPDRSSRGCGAASRGRANGAPRRICSSPARSCHVAPELPSAPDARTHATDVTLESPPSRVGSEPTVWSGYGAERSQPVATGGNWRPRRPLKEAKTVAVVATGCRGHNMVGRGRRFESVRGLSKPRERGFHFRLTCSLSSVRRVWSPLFSVEKSAAAPDGSGPCGLDPCGPS